MAELLQRMQAVASNLDAALALAVDTCGTNAEPLGILDEPLAAQTTLNTLGSNRSPIALPPTNPSLNIPPPPTP